MSNCEKEGLNTESVREIDGVSFLTYPGFWISGKFEEILFSKLQTITSHENVPCVNHKFLFWAHILYDINRAI